MTYTTDLEQSLQIIETIEHKINTEVRAIIKPIYDSYSHNLNIYKELTDDNYVESDLEVDFWLIMADNIPKLSYSRSNADAYFCMCADILPLEDLAQMLSDELAQNIIVPDNVKIVLDFYYTCCENYDIKAMIYNKYHNFISDNNYIVYRDICDHELHVYTLTDVLYDNKDQTYLVYDTAYNLYYFCFGGDYHIPYSARYQKSFLSAILAAIKFCDLK
jgi:hypothetical protein